LVSQLALRKCLPICEGPPSAGEDIFAMWLADRERLADGAATVLTGDNTVPLGC